MTAAGRTDRDPGKERQARAAEDEVDEGRQRDRATVEKKPAVVAPADDAARAPNVLARGHPLVGNDPSVKHRGAAAAITTTSANAFPRQTGRHFRAIASAGSVGIRLRLPLLRSRIPCRPHRLTTIFRPAPAGAPWSCR
jgi:hypothetical protein